MNLSKTCQCLIHENTRNYTKNVHTRKVLSRYTCINDARKSHKDYIPRVHYKSKPCVELQVFDAPTHGDRIAPLPCHRHQCKKTSSFLTLLSTVYIEHQQSTPERVVATDDAAERDARVESRVSSPIHLPLLANWTHWLELVLGLWRVGLHRGCLVAGGCRLSRRCDWCKCL